MSEALFTLLLALAWFGAVCLLVSAVVALASWALERRVFRLRPSSAPAVLLALKLLPGAAAVLFTFAVFLPAQWRFEPRGVEESPGYTLVALGCLGAVTVLLAVRRAVSDARLTRRLEREWEGRASRPETRADQPVPVYALPDAAPIIALAGVRHPRVFIARPVLDAFSADELDVSLAHELAHDRSRDNLKRMLMSCSPDLLALWHSGRAIERRWRAAIEFAADAVAVRGSEERAVSLASALLKVARLSPEVGAASVGSNLFDGTLLRARIDRLLAPETADEDDAPALGRAWSISIGGATLLAMALTAEGLWLSVHHATEGLVRFLP